MPNCNLVLPSAPYVLSYLHATHVLPTCRLGATEVLPKCCLSATEVLPECSLSYLSAAYVLSATYVPPNCYPRATRRATSMMPKNYLLPKLCSLGATYELPRCNPRAT